MPKHRFITTPSGAKYVEVVEDKGVRNSTAAEDATKRLCFKRHDSIGLAPFHLVNGREIHEACTKALWASTTTSGTHSPPRGCAN